MIVGVPREIKVEEYRVGLAPAGVRELVDADQTVLVETGAGEGSAFDDAAYRAAGAEVVDSAAAVFERADMIVKVKEPQPAECAMLRDDQLLFTYLHLAPDPGLTRSLQKCGCVAIAYETVTGEHGGLPLLAPMSEVAGRMSVQVGARCLEKASGGAGMLLGGVPGVAPARVVVLGGGVAGINATRMAVGLGADVTVIECDLERVKQMDEAFAGRVKTLYSTAEAIERSVLDADLVIGTVLVPGAAAPKLVTREMVGRMKKGAAVVDVAVDQGGCFETTRATTHKDPIFVVDDVVHYCVANMPGAVARTSTQALTNATLPYVLMLATRGAWSALAEDRHLRDGLNVCRGAITHRAVARDLGLDYTPAQHFIGSGSRAA